MNEAFVFISLTPGVDPLTTLKSIKKIPNVKRANLVYGPVDVIATVRADDTTAVLATVTAIHNLAGVSNTDTRPVAA